MQTDTYKIPVSMLSPPVDPERFGFENASELQPLTGTIGQERAVEALEFAPQLTDITES